MFYWQAHREARERALLVDCAHSVVWKDAGGMMGDRYGYEVWRRAPFDAVPESEGWKVVETFSPTHKRETDHA